VAHVLQGAAAGVPNGYVVIPCRVALRLLCCASAPFASCSPHPVWVLMNRHNARTFLARILAVVAAGTLAWTESDSRLRVVFFFCVCVCVFFVGWEA
jgi:hypothetical protein